MMSYLNRHRLLILFLLFILSFSIRVVYSGRDYFGNGTKNWSDALLYLDNGKSFARGDFYPVFAGEGMVVGPMVPLVIAASKLITKDPVWPILVLNCLLGALLVFVLFALGSRLIGVWAGFLLALWSIFNYTLISFCSQTLKEPFIFLILPLLVLFMLNIYQKKRVLLNTVLSALLYSVLIHTDERFMVYAPLLVIFIFLANARKDKLKLSLAWLAILILTMLPWTFRNYRQFGQVVILSPRTTAVTSRFWGTDLVKLHFNTEEGREQVIAKRMDNTLNAMAAYGVIPRAYGKYEKYWKAFVHYWQPVYHRMEFIQYGFRPVKWTLAHNLVSVLFYGIFLPFYLAALLLALWKKDWLILLLGAIPLLHSLLHTALIWPLERYRLPLNFIIVLLALWTVNCIFNRQKNLQAGRLQDET